MTGDLEGRDMAILEDWFAFLLDARNLEPDKFGTQFYFLVIVLP